MVNRVGAHVEDLLRQKLVTAIDSIWEDEEFTDNFDPWLGSDTVHWAAEAALAVIMAQSNIQSEGVEQGWWKEEEV